MDSAASANDAAHVGGVAQQAQLSRPIDEASAVRDTAWFRTADLIAETVGLAGRCGRALVTRPANWRAELIEQAAFVVTRCAVPLALCAAFISFATNVISIGSVAHVLGASDRLGAFTGIDALREFASWVTGMVLAGIAGTAICADLGARKVRDELDAMAVLGVDYYRALVLPRVLAITLVGPLMYLWAVAWSVIPVYVFGQSIAGFTAASFRASFSTLLTIDLYGGLIKVLLIGLVVGVVSCVKGLRATGGPAGVGRSVNEAVVLAFVATWVISLLFNAFLQSAFPSTQALR